MRKPWKRDVDLGPDTEPSLEARPDLGASLATDEQTPPPEPEVAGPPAPEAGETAESPDKVSELPPPPAKPVVVPGQYHNLKRRTAVATVVAVWIPAAAIGLGLYYWWFHSLDKTWPVFAVLIFIVLCSVSGMLVAMVEPRPALAAIAIALMAAPLAAVAAAAVLHGVYFCERVSPCLVGVIPY